MTKTLALEDQFREEDVIEIEAKHAAILDEHRAQADAARRAFDWDMGDDIDEMWGGPIR